MEEQKRSTTKRHTPKGFGTRLVELKALGLTRSDAIRLLSIVLKQRKSRGALGAKSYLDSLESVMKAKLYAQQSVPNPSVWIQTTPSGFPTKLKFLRKYSNVIQRRLVPLKRLLIDNAQTDVNIQDWLSAATKPFENNHQVQSVRKIIFSGIDWMKFNLKMPSMVTSVESVGNLPNMITLKNSQKTSCKNELQRLVVLEILRNAQHISGTKCSQNRYIKNTFKYLDHLKTDLRFGLETLMSSSSDFADYAYNSGDENPTLVGSVHGTSEPGLKLRIFASPRLVYQASLSPMQSKLKELLKILDSDVTTDQESGALWAQDILKSGGRIWSIDQRKATDLFPYYLQREVLFKLGISDELIDILDQVVTGHWLTPKAWNINRRVQWTRGQPLGVLPSFALYALTHNLLLHGICQLLRVNHNCFRILGDDIVISNEAVAEYYQTALKAIGVELSLQKSIFNDTFAEFAGFHISANHMTRCGKFRKLDPDNLFNKLMDPDFEHPELLLPRSSRKIMFDLKHMSFPFGFVRRDDNKFFLDSEMVEKAVDRIINPVARGSLDLNTFVYNLIYNVLYPIMGRREGNLESKCNDWLKINELNPFLDGIVINSPALLRAAENLPSFEYRIMLRYARRIVKIFSVPDMSYQDHIIEEPLVSRSIDKITDKQSFVKQLMSTYPLGNLPCEDDKWCVLKLIRRYQNGMDVHDTPKTMMKHWLNA